MLRIHTSTSASSAKSYFSTADYYSEGQELRGVWRGEGAKHLGLCGTVQQQDWDALCDNRDPRTGRSLTARRKAERRVGFEVTIDVPKSVSLLYGLTGDERLLDAFQSAIDDTMSQIESEAKVRVRKGGKNEDRTTANFACGQYIHFTSRPVNGVPDPNLHTHGFVFNATWDERESRWAALQIGDIKRDAPYYQAVFDSRMARALAELGLEIERTRTGYEIAGLGRATLDKFSRRTAEIERVARAKGITDPKQKGALGAKIRESKVKHIPMDELREEWSSRLAGDENERIQRISQSVGGPAYPQDPSMARDAVAWAAEHCFERASVLPERRVLAAAMRRALGTASPESIREAFDRYGFIWTERDGQRMVTTREVLAEERTVIDYARRSRGSRRPLGLDGGKSHIFKFEKINEGQRRAVLHVLGSTDGVILVRGAAGVGKTTMMREAIDGIEAAGTRVFTFAPTADASRGVLRLEGFENADTVARLLKDEELQAEIQGQAIWVDEAGLIGTRTMKQLFDLAKRLDARIILSGDRYQHGSVERGAALRILETEADLIPAEIREIQRQKGEYKQAVLALSEGRMEDGFKIFDELGWIREIATEDREKSLADEYVRTVRAGKTALVVSPTHIEGRRVTTQIRAALKEAGKLGKDERAFRILRNSNFTQAERRDLVNYDEDCVLVYHQNAKGVRKGERITVGSGATPPLEQADRFQVFHADMLAVAPGDLIRITQNGKTSDGEHRLNNGAIFTVESFTVKGDLQLTNGWVIDRDFGHFVHGYTTTSHASQGKTVDKVLIGQSSDSFPASSREQAYVSASRAREGMVWYTDDKQALLKAISRSDDRLTATELIAGREFVTAHHQFHRREPSPDDIVLRSQRARGFERHADREEMPHV